MHDPAELNYGVGFIRSLDLMVEAGTWTPKNNKVDIVVGDSEYNTLIAEGTKQAIADSGGKWELGEESEVQGGITDWSPILQKLQQSDAGVIMIDHWIGAELAAFAQQFSANPVPGSLVYLQYGPSQPEFLDIAGESAEGFYWGTMIGVPNTGAAAEFRTEVLGEVPGRHLRPRVHRLVLRHGPDASRTPGRTSTRPTSTPSWTGSRAIRTTARTGHIDFSNVETPTYPVNAATPGGGRHAPLLPGAGRRSTRSWGPRCTRRRTTSDAAVGLGG